MGIWKELSVKGDATEKKPLRPKNSKPKTSYVEKSPEEPDMLDTGFTVREISPQAMRIWLAIQVVGLLFQFSLWREVSSHLAEFEGVVARECAPQHLTHGVCAGPSWNTSAFQDFVLHHQEMHSFEFTTSSVPPTFLLVVDPVAQAKALSGKSSEPEAAPADFEAQDVGLQSVHWSVEVRRMDPPQTGQALKRYHYGQEVVTVEDLSDEANSTLQSRGSIRWQATVAPSSSFRRNTRFVAFVEDAASAQLTQIHSSQTCAFAQSWKAFNQQHQGHNHRALAWCAWLLGIFLCVGAAAVYAVQQELAFRANQPGSRRFHSVVFAKFLLQDAPQQICVVLYLFGWYEAAGLRCQLCLFEPQHCGYEDPFHFGNTVALSCLLLSSLANQLLIRPTVRRKYTEDDICMHYWIRIGGTCVATLPFTTGLCLASRSVLPDPTLFHLLFAVPCAVGWLSLSGFFCLGFAFCCDDDYI